MFCDTDERCDEGGEVGAHQILQSFHVLALRKEGFELVLLLFDRRSCSRRQRANSQR